MTSSAQRNTDRTLVLGARRKASPGFTPPEPFLLGIALPGILVYLQQEDDHLAKDHA